MAVFEVMGGNPLSGEISLSGAKNAALPILFGSLMSSGTVKLHNVPTGMQDIKVAIKVIRKLGARVVVKGSDVTIDPSTICEAVIPYELASKIRSSLLMLGIFLSRFGKVLLPFPGGCDIGSRKFDLHIDGLRQLGADIDMGEEAIKGSVSSFKGADIEFYLPSTTGTQNVMLGACLAKGKTIIRNANTRPEIEDFTGFLNSMGAKIRMSNRLVEIEGVKKLKGTEWSIMKGSDEAMTYMIAAGMTGGEVKICDYDLEHLRIDVQYLREAGIEIFEWGGSVYVSGKKGLKPFHLFTAPYPGVNSDLQPLFAALALAVPGESSITDQRFTDRFAYVPQLKSFGGEIDHYGNCAVVTGGNPLKGAKVRATDLRGGVAEILTGFISSGKTIVDNIYQIDRGYERIERKFSRLGAHIKRKS
ncbi:MAG: UDP-N-acetylglucosamine 1-carboxyvinyltransferase [Bacteroidales bacterium]|nr:UDP-N-acetylglucosamine 1-carboxyvinyltransferase [Candidatus Latescibacterota bacterium]